MDFSDILGKKFVNVTKKEAYFYNCWQCCREIYRKYFDIELPFHFFVDAYDTQKINEIIQNQKVSEKWKQLEKPKIPCIVTIKFNSPSLINHVGVYVGENQFIHCREKTGVVISKIDSPAWKRSIEGFYEYKP